MARKRRAHAYGGAWKCSSTERRLGGGLRCGIRRCSGGRALGSGTRRGQHWDRLRVSRLHRRANLRATCLLRPAPSLLQSTLCRLWPLTAAIPASLSPGTTLSPLLLLLLIRPRLHKFRENRCEGKTDPAGCQPLNIRSVLRQHVPRGLPPNRHLRYRAARRPRSARTR